VIIITIEFDFNGFPHVLTLASNYVMTALRLIRNEFDEHFGINGLRRNRFIIGNTLTATVVDYEVFDYGEREHDEVDDYWEDDEDEDEANEINEDNYRPDPQSRD
jgi:hypothetical protein